jgi:hypothetical protein
MSLYGTSRYHDKGIDHKFCTHNIRITSGLPFYQLCGSLTTCSGGGDHEDSEAKTEHSAYPSTQRK